MFFINAYRSRGDFRKSMIFELNSGAPESFGKAAYARKKVNQHNLGHSLSFPLNIRLTMAKAFIIDDVPASNKRLTRT